MIIIIFFWHILCANQVISRRFGCSDNLLVIIKHSGKGQQEKIMSKLKSRKAPIYVYVFIVLLYLPAKVEVVMNHGSGSYKRDHPGNLQNTLIPYMYKFLRYVIFAVNLSSAKISSSKFLCWIWYALIGEQLEYTWYGYALAGTVSEVVDASLEQITAFTSFSMATIVDSGTISIH